MTEYSEVILISEKYDQDAIGQPISVEKHRDPIPCTVASVGRDEWSTAAQGGYEADIMLRVFRACYNGEKAAIYHGHKYEIYRSYATGDSIELYLGTRIGEYIG